MPNPLVVTVSHDLGREKAAERLRERIGAVRQMLGGHRIAVVNDEWDGDRLNLSLGVLGQTVQGKVDVEDTLIRIEVQLPWVLASFADRIRTLVQAKAPALLGHEPPKE